MIGDLQETFARVRAALRRRGRSEQDADDLVQEAWLRLAATERQEVIKKPEAYMMRAALNLSVDSFRAAEIRGEQLLLEDVLLLDTAPSLEAVVLSRERLARISKGLGRLDEKTRVIFLAHRFDGMTYQNIANVHGISVSAVEKHVAKAMLQLTRWMEGW